MLQNLSIPRIKLHKKGTQMRIAMYIHFLFFKYFLNIFQVAPPRSKIGIRFKHKKDGSFPVSVAYPLSWLSHCQWCRISNVDKLTSMRKYIPTPYPYTREGRKYNPPTCYFPLHYLYTS